ncbi:MFS transporter [Paraburkholderia acidisoli]|uniref:MFS transporter n=1 Tax=Paraburkholderia acidisoli TaxID=2571748 RepID=A0A7Z2JJL0_9BURK|nr:MFS transporter [Paraburkholderia acidisoli]QGZ65424.1 MFS transporter [Paraburkholderia acidisoli]
MTKQGERIARRRWLIGVFIGVGILVNYVDRVTISVAAPQLREAFALSPAQLGVLFSAFSWTYALLQIPAGLVLDRYGVTRVGRWGALLWAVSSLVTALASGFGGLLAARLLLGVAEPPGLAVCSKATGYWFPRAERALATALFDAAAKFANVIGVPFIALIVVTFGWRWGFAASAALSVAYFVGFCVIYRDPSHDTKLQAAELAWIREGGATPEGAATAGAAGMFGYLVTHRKVWGLTIGYAAYDYAFYLFLTWLPSYLVDVMHMSMLRSAGLAMIPWAWATFTDLAIGGWLIDTLIARGRDESRVRKAVLIAGLLSALGILGVIGTHDARWAIAWISVSLGGLAIAGAVTWSIPSLIAPKGAVGAVSGIMNCVGNVLGAIAPMLTGFIVSATHSFENAFWVAGAIIFAGILAIVFMLGKIEPIAGPQIVRARERDAMS